MLSDAEAKAAAKDLRTKGRVEWARLRRYARYARGQQALPWLPDNVESEYRDIARKSASNWIDLIIRTKAQGLQVDGYGSDATLDEWRAVWQANGMDARQHALHRAVLTLGYSFLFVLPTEAEDGEPSVWMRPDAATRVAARYEDESDEWPQLVLREVDKDRCELYDAEARYTITGKNLDSVSVFPHELGVCPVVQFRNQIDLLGAPMGEVEPTIPIQDRIVDATFTLQMVAKYGAFPQRWIAGMSVPMKKVVDEETGEVTDEAVQPTIKAYVDSILMAADPDTKFGQFSAADLRQYVDALEAHIRHLAAITQTPAHYLLGSTDNPPSAEALAAAESGWWRDIVEKQDVYGEAYEQAFRLAASALGDEVAAQDTASQVHWQDVGSRSLAQVADAIVKLQTVGVPNGMLFKMIPGWTQTDVDAALDMVDQADPLRMFADRLNGGAGQPAAAA